MFNKKYEFTDEKVTLPSGKVMYRIRAIRDIPAANVKAGDLGGFIQKQRNLSQSGDCWVDYTSYAIHRSRVTDNAQICCHSGVRNGAQIGGNSTIRNNLIISGESYVHDVYLTGNPITRESKVVGSWRRVKKHKRNATINNIIMGVAIAIMFFAMWVIIAL